MNLCILNRRCLQLFVPLFAVVLAVVTSLALADGTVRAWGWNASGQCNILDLHTNRGHTSQSYPALAAASNASGLI